MRRVAIVGSSGAGKSTVAEKIGIRLGLQVIELDALVFGPGWTHIPTPEFRSKVVEAIEQAGDTGWVIPGNYRTVADIVQRGADTVVWLDLPRRVVTWRLVKRSLRRGFTREKSWGGNRERLRHLLSRDPEKNVVLWSWQHHEGYQEIYETYATGEFWAGADLHRLRSSDEVDEFLSGLSRPEH